MSLEKGMTLISEFTQFTRQTPFFRLIRPALQGKDRPEKHICTPETVFSEQWIYRPGERPSAEPP